MEHPDPSIGLCATCQQCRRVTSARATFYLCERSFVDSRFRKYPPLPVLQCLGYDPTPAGADKPDTSGF